MIELILASVSPRRQMLLEQIGWPHWVVPSFFQELTGAADPAALVAANALGKAREVAGRFDTGVVLGADTVVVSEGQVLEKPGDSLEARAMLTALAGHWHEVLTGLALIDCATGEEKSDVVVTRVHMRHFLFGELEAYLDTGEPYDKAGAYGIQGAAALFIDRVEGCYYNVVGLPLSRLAELMGELRGDL